jgi:hypothetical protein
VKTRAALMLILLVLPNAASAAPPADSALIAFITPMYHHGLPYGKGRAFGPRAIPTLERLLRDEAYKRQWPNIVLTIGFIADVRSFEILRAFTWERFRGEIDGPTFAAMQEVPSAMGCIVGARRQAPEVVIYLERGCDPKTWRRLPWTQGNLSAEDGWFVLSKRCVSGLSWTGTAETDRFLHDLSAKPYDQRHRSVVQSALERNRKILKVGLPAYIEAARKEREGR